MRETESSRLVGMINQINHKQKKESLLPEESKFIELMLDAVAPDLREWWTRSEVVLSNARLGITVER